VLFNMNHTAVVIRTLSHQFFFQSEIQDTLPCKDKNKTNKKKQVSIICVMFVRVMKEQLKIVLSVIS